MLQYYVIYRIYYVIIICFSHAQVTAGKASFDKDLQYILLLPLLRDHLFLKLYQYLYITMKLC